MTVLGARLGDWVTVEFLEGRRRAVEVQLAGFSEDFTGLIAHMDRRALNRLLERFDGWASSADIEPLDAPHRPEPTIVPADAPLAIDLRRRGIETIIWATGYHPHCTWLELPVFDSHGRIRHTGGVMQGSPGGVADGTQECNRSFDLARAAA